MGYQPLHLFLLVLLLWICQTHTWSWSSTKKQTNGNSGPLTSAKNAEFSLQTNTYSKGVQLIENAKTKMVSSYSCWQTAYRNLFAGCSEMIASKEKQSRLAWELSDCFQKESGRSPFPSCDVETPMKKCLKNLDEFAHKIYLEFFLESNFICHQLQSEAFKHETERLVNELIESAQLAEEKLDKIEGASDFLLKSSSHIEESLVSINSHTQEVAQTSKQVEHQIDNVMKSSKAIYDQSQEIVASQVELQEGQLQMRVRMETGMTLLQESYENLGDGMEKLKKDALHIEEEIQAVGNSMSLRMQDLQSSADDIENVAGMSLEKQKELLDGQSVALEGLNSLTNFQTQALEESRAILQNLSKYSQKQQEELLRRQEQLQLTHERLIQNSMLILAAQEAFESKQANMFSTLDQVFTLLNSIVLESRLIETSIHYFGAVLFTYLLTSTKPISHVRTYFYLGIILTFTIEFVVIRRYVLSFGHQSWIESNMFWLRSTFLLLIALALCLYSIRSYRDYEQLNYQLLLTLKGKIEVLEKNSATIYRTLERDSNLSSWVDTDLLEDEEICDDPDYLLPEEVAENSVTTSLSRKYDLRPRRRN